MKFGQLIEHNMRNIFLEKSHADEILFPDTFLKNQNENQKIKNQSFMQLVFIVCKVEDYQNILKLSCRLLAFTSCNTF